MSTRIRIAVVVVSLAVIVATVGTAWLVWRSAGRPAQAGTVAGTKFICPMHPQIVQDGPGSCPICKMDLVPATPDDEPKAPPPPSPEHAAHPVGAPAPTPEGLARVRLPADKALRIGARSIPATRERFEREVRAAGTVTVDETRLRQVHTKTAGWVERLWADAEGATVRRGQPLLEIYSPELLAAQQEFLVALRARAHLETSSVAEIAGTGNALLEAARHRLRLLDLNDAEIAALEAGGVARRTVVLNSPISGTILKRGIAQGARVEPATLLLEVADLSHVWVLAAVYEYELPFVREGQGATMTLPYLPGQEYRGRVTKVYPTLDAATRTVQIRVEFANPGVALKPDMYAEVRLIGDLGERLAVPDEAVLETGVRSVVFVDEGDGVYAPREIRIGLRVPGRVEVLSGLREGERILAQGNFFVDSESRLRAGLEAAGRDAAAPAASDHQH